VGERRGQIDHAGRPIDRGGLHGCDFVLAERLADDIQAAGQRGVAERPLPLARPPGTNGCRFGVLRIDQLGLGFRERTSQSGEAITKLDRGMRGLPSDILRHDIERHCARF